MRRHGMQMLSLSSKQRYGIAILSVIAAALLRALLEWLLKADLYLPFFIVPVMAAGWYGGLWPGLLATGLSLLGDLHHEALLDTKRLPVFVFTGVVVSILCARARQVAIGITSDITERKNAEEKLKESDDRYRAFIANSSEGIWRYELDEPVPVTLPADEQVELLYCRGYLAECNEVFARSHGRTSVDEIIGERLTVLLVRSDAEKIIEYSRLFVRSGYRLIGAETREVDIHGNTKYFLSNLIGIQQDGKLVRAWGTQRDITAQKRTEQALRASEERMHRITDATQDALWEIDLSTKHLWWSEGARPLFGRSPAELQIGLSDWYDGIHPEDRDRVRSQFENFMSGTAIDWVDEYRFRRADGIYVYIHDEGRKFYDEGGGA